MSKKEVKLKDRDYSEIFQGAHRTWLERAAVEYFHVRCIIDSFLGFTKRNKLIVKDGKIYKDDSNE